MRDPHESYHRPGLARDIAAPDAGRVPAADFAELGGQRARARGRDRGRDGQRKSTEPPVSVCLAEPCVEGLVRALEQVFKTGRGASVKGPATCVQPVSSSDVDDFIVGRTDLIPIAAGDRATLLSVRAAGNQVVAIKGFNAFVVGGVSASLDPYTRLRFTIRVAGVPHAPYREMAFQPGAGLAGLRAATIIARPGQTVALEIERYAGAGTEGFAVSAAWKGWSFVPIRTDSGSPSLGLEAF